MALKKPYDLVLCTDQFNPNLCFRYKIYAEGFAWSVSLKYILSCGSMALVIDPQYEDFFSRGLRPEVNFWPVHIDVAAGGMCESIRDAVEWGEAHPAEAEAVGRRGQRLMEELDMDAVYDYMLHLLTEYARLMRFRPAEALPPRRRRRRCARRRCCASPARSRGGSWRHRRRAPPCRSLA